MSLPPETFSRNGKDFTAQIRKHFDWILAQEPVPADHTPFERYLAARVLTGRKGDWIDSLALNVASRACEVLGLLLDRGPEAALTGHGAADWVRFGARGYEVLSAGPDALCACLAAVAGADGGRRRFFGRAYGPWMAWLGGRGLGEEAEPLRAVVRRHVFQTFPIRKGVTVLGLPSEGRAASGPPAAAALTGLGGTALDGLVRRGLARRDRCGGVVLNGFVTDRMLDAYRRETTAAVRPAEDSPREAEGNGPRVATPGGPLLARGLSLSEAAGYLRVTAKTVTYLTEQGLLSRADPAGRHRKGTRAVSQASLRAFRARYISLGELAELLKRPQGALSMRLRNTGIDMLAMPPDFSRIYWREDVLAADPRLS
ncbi:MULTISPECIES: hypothetical protein [Rhodovulum]|uniref:Helix-turn-helix protein n=1 Tax=Rhodovulum kholense TaxID=453584 RepID=A0A8E3AP06_9RHOB|nr:MULTISPECIES: hypothetical protein [Rhodovulum]PTW33649.1 hypothetical protein C8N38_1451 [Rhodovulum kholense]